MDYRAIAELIWFTFLGLSVFGVVLGFTVRAFLAPVVREIAAMLVDGRSDRQARSDARIDFLESRVGDLEAELRRVAAAEEFHRELRAPPAAEDP
ncbi:MAG: hypothetical protein RJQ04_15605 [Longimicrobiales bacterium]